MAKYNVISIYKFASVPTVASQNIINDETKVRKEIENRVPLHQDTSLTLNVSKVKEIESEGENTNLLSSTELLYIALSVLVSDRFWRQLMEM